MSDACLADLGSYAGGFGLLGSYVSSFQTRTVRLFLLGVKSNVQGEAMTTAVQVFSFRFKFHKVRTISRNGEP